MNFIKEYSGLSATILIGLALLSSGCGKEGDEEDTSTVLETVIPGTYSTTGMQYNKIYPSWPPFDYEPDYDTISVDPTITLEQIDSSDYRIYGMIGLEYMETKEGPDDCVTPEYCGFSGVYSDSLRFDISDPGGQVVGSAIVKGDSIFFNYSYHYRNVFKDFILVGVRDE